MKKTPNIFGILFLTAILGIAFFDVLFLNKTFKVSSIVAQAVHTGVYNQQFNKVPFIPLNGVDSAILEEPIYAFIKNSFSKGIIPLWNPHQACGIPLLAMLEIGIFFPINFIIYLIPDKFGWDLLMLSRFLLGGIFVFSFMRYFRITFWPSILAAVCYMLSGPMVLLQYWYVNVDILLPLLLISVHNLINRLNARSIAINAIVVGLTIFAGHPEHIFFVHLYAFIFLSYLLFTSKNKVEFLSKIPAISFSYIVGLALSAVVFFPFLRNFSSEFWNAHPHGTGLLAEYEPGSYMSLVFPHIFQKVPVTTGWDFAGWWGGYLGLIPVGLAFISLFSKQRRGMNYFFVLMAFLITAKMYGLPFINWIGHLPLFKMCRFTVHSSHLVAFSVAIAAGMGLRYVMNCRKVFFQALIYPVMLLLSVVIFMIFGKDLLVPEFTNSALLYALGILTLFLSLLFIHFKLKIKRSWIASILTFIVFVELFSYINRDRPEKYSSFDKVPYIEAIKKDSESYRVYGYMGTLNPNTASGYGIDDLGVFFALIPKRYVEFVNHFLVKDNFASDLRPTALRSVIPSKPNNSIFMNMLNVKYLVLPPMEHLSRISPLFDIITKPYDKIYENEATVFHRSTAWPRVGIFHWAVFQENETKTIELMNKIAPQLEKILVITHKPIESIINNNSIVPLIDNSSAKITNYSPNEVDVFAKMEHKGFLFLADSYHPDWEVFVDGKAVELFQANYMFRAVYLNEGVHEVKFRFYPKSFKWGLVVSSFAFIFILALMLYRIPIKP